MARGVRPISGWARAIFAPHLVSFLRHLCPEAATLERAQAQPVPILKRWTHPTMLTLKFTPPVPFRPLGTQQVLALVLTPLLDAMNIRLTGLPRHPQNMLVRTRLAPSGNYL